MKRVCKEILEELLEDLTVERVELIDDFLDRLFDAGIEFDEENNLEAEQLLNDISAYLKAAIEANE